jgi:hypothetical protein
MGANRLLAFSAAFAPILGSAWAAHAKCGSRALEVWPRPGATIAPAERLILEGYGGSQPFVATLSSRSPELVPEVPGRAAVPLRVIATYYGERGITQSVLVPSQPLRVNTRYRLDAQGLGQHKFGRWSWEVRDRAAGLPPAWTSAPSAAGGDHVRFGCGPARHAYIEAGLRGDDVWVRVGVRAAGQKGPSREFLLRMKDGRLSIGHGMCSGAYKLLPGVAYQVTLVAVDAFGREASASGGPVRVQGPPLHE